MDKPTSLPSVELWISLEEHLEFGSAGFFPRITPGEVLEKERWGEQRANWHETKRAALNMSESAVTPRSHSYDAWPL